MAQGGETLRWVVEGHLVPLEDAQDPRVLSPRGCSRTRARHESMTASTAEPYERPSALPTIARCARGPGAGGREGRRPSRSRVRCRRLAGRERCSSDGVAGLHGGRRGSAPAHPRAQNHCGRIASGRRARARMPPRRREGCCGRDPGDRYGDRDREQRLEFGKDTHDGCLSIRRLPVVRNAEDRVARRQDQGAEPFADQLQVIGVRARANGSAQRMRELGTLLRPMHHLTATGVPGRNERGAGQ